MTQVNNDIKVLFRKYSTDIKTESVLGELYLYDNSTKLSKEDGLSYSLLKDYYFTGISIEGLSSEIKMTILDINYKDISFLLHKGFIYVKKHNEVSNGIVGIVSFVPKEEGHWVGDYFYAHYIELT